MFCCLGLVLCFLALFVVRSLCGSCGFCLWFFGVGVGFFVFRFMAFSVWWCFVVM